MGIQCIQPQIVYCVCVSDARVLGCETQPVMMEFPNESVATSAERTFYCKDGDYSAYYVLIFRVFLDGYYQEPPPELLPPVPVMQATSSASTTDCCAIS